MKTRATFVLDEDLLIELKKMAIDEKKTYSESLEELIKMKVNGLIKNNTVRGNKKCQTKKNQKR